MPRGWRRLKERVSEFDDGAGGWGRGGLGARDLSEWRTGMDAEQNLTVKAAQGAFEELLELAELGAQDNEPRESEAFREEAQATVLMLMP